jgi:hypothetical protein
MGAIRRTGKRGRGVGGGLDQSVRRILIQDRGGTGDSC